MKKAFVPFWSAILAAAPAFAGGLAHADHFEMRRDGAWIVNFALLLAGLLWIIIRFVIPALKQRSALLQQEMDDSERARKESLARLAELEGKLKAFESEAARIRQDAVDEGEKLKKQIIAEAEIASRRLLDKAQAEVESETIKARGRLKKEAVEMAMAMAADMLKKNVNEKDHQGAVKQYAQSVGGRK